MNASPRGKGLLFLLLAAILLLLFPMDLRPGRTLVTYRADRFAPWGPPSKEPSFNADCLRSYYPRRVFAVSALREGRIPLWDPGSFCGQPFLANFQSGVFYPGNLILLPFSPERQMGIFVWLHLLLAAWGMFLLLRDFGLSDLPSLAGGLLFATSGALAVRTGQPTMLATPAWIPLLLYLAGRTVRGGALLPLAAAYACTILAGFPPKLIWASLLALAWVIHEWLPLRGESGLRPLVRAGGAFLVGIAFTAVQLVPTAELLAHSDRIRFDYPTLLSSSWHPAALVRLLVPDWFGSPFDENAWLHLLRRGNGHYFQSYLSTACYVGAGTLLFAATGLSGAWKNRGARLLLLAGGVASLFLLGTPFLRLLAGLPGIGGSRIDRIVPLVTIALVVPAAFGLERLRKGGGGRKSAAVAALLLGVAALALYLLRGELARRIGGWEAMPFVDADPGLSKTLRALFFVAVAAFPFFLPPRLRASPALLAVAGLFLVADAGWNARRCHVTVSGAELPGETDEIATLRALSARGRMVRFRDPILPPNLPGLFGIEDVAGYNALNLKEYRRAYRSFAPESVKERRINPLVRHESLDDPLLRAMSARWIVSGRRSPVPGFPVVASAPFVIRENVAAYPRAFVASVAPVRTDGPDEAVAAMRRAGALPGTVFLEGGGPAIPAGRARERTVGEWIAAHGAPETSLAGSAPLDGRAVVAERRPERVVVDCAAAEGGILTLTDTYYPGWKATLDGRSVPVVRVNGLFRGVAVGPGVHRVVFAFEPLSFRIGAALSLLSITGAALFRGRRILLRKRRETG